jgi:hypothetical protein
MKKQTQFPKWPKMNANVFITKDYENETAFRPKKTNPNKANFFKGQNELKIACRKIRPHPMAKHGSFLLALNRTMVNNSRLSITGDNKNETNRHQKSEVRSQKSEVGKQKS